MKHSVWLIPEQSAGQEIQSCIDGFAQATATPVFQAHATLIGGLDGSEDRTIQHCRACIQTAGPIAAHVRKVACSDDFFMSMYLELQVDKGFTALRNDLVTRLQIAENNDPEPHVSLAYGLENSRQKTALTQSAERKFTGQSFRLGQLAVVRSSKSIPIPDWRVLWVQKIECFDGRIEGRN